MNATKAPPPVVLVPPACGGCGNETNHMQYCQRCASEFAMLVSVTLSPTPHGRMDS